MHKKQENKLSSYHLTDDKLNLHNGIWAGIPAFSATKGVFSNKIVSIHSVNAIQQGIITGIATDKKDLKVTMIDATAAVAGNVKALASQTNNNELFDAVNYSHSDLMKVRDENIADICQTIHNHANTHLVALAPFGITAPVLTALQLAITAYVVKVQAPGGAKIAKKTATANLRILFKDTDKLLDKELDPMMLQFKNTEPDFFKDYTSAREIIDLGATHTTFRILVKDQNGDPLAGAMVALLQSNLVVYTAVSGADGKVAITKIKPGTFDLKILKTNFTTKTETGILFKAGKAVKRTVTLNPGAPVSYITIVREADVPENSVANISTDGVKGTPLTMVTIEVSLGPLSFYSAATPDALPGPVHYDRPVGIITLSLADFVAAIGFGTGSELLNVRNAGPSLVHYKITFTNLEP